MRDNLSALGSNICLGCGSNVTNTDGIILKVSDATGDIYNVNSADMVGKSVYDLEKEGVFSPILNNKQIFLPISFCRSIYTFFYPCFYRLS